MRYLLLTIIILNQLYSQTKDTDISLLINNSYSSKYTKLLVKILKKDISKKYSLNININISNNKEDAINDFLTQKSKIIIAHPFFYFENKKILDTQSYLKWIFKFKEKEIEQYYLISNKKNKEVLSDISKYKIYTIKGIDNSLIWLKYFYYKKYEKKFPLKKHIYSERIHKIMYKVFFNKNSIGVITKSSYDLLTELNPQLKKRIKILKKSEPIFISFLAFNNKDMNIYEKDTFKKLSQTRNLLIDDKNILSQAYIGISTLHNNNELKKLNSFYKEYKILEKIYK